MQCRKPNMEGEIFRRLPIDEQHAAAILRFLEGREPALATEMKSVSRNYNKVMETAWQLEKEGLVSIETIEKPRLRYEISLTPKGRRVAEKLKEIEGILEG